MLWMIRIRRPRHTCELIRKQWCRLVITSLPSVETCVKRQYLASLKRLSLVWTQASHSYKKMCFRICALEEPWWVQRGHTSQSWNKTGRKRAESWGLSQGTGTEMPWGRGQSWCISPVTTGCPFHLLHFHILAKNTFGCAFFFFFFMFLVSKYGLDLNGRWLIKKAVGGVGVGKAPLWMSGGPHIPARGARGFGTLSWARTLSVTPWYLFEGKARVLHTLLQS